MTRILAAALIASAALTGAASALTSTSAVAQQQIERVLPGQRVDDRGIQIGQVFHDPARRVGVLRPQMHPAQRGAAQHLGRLRRREAAAGIGTVQHEAGIDQVIGAGNKILHGQELHPAGPAARANGGLCGSVQNCTEMAPRPRAGGKPGADHAKSGSLTPP